MQPSPTGPESVLDARLQALLGDASDAIEAVELRLSQLYPRERAIVWESDAGSFAFTWVSAGVVPLLGYPRARWTLDPGFWAEHLVHPDDRREAIAYRALATAKRADHVVEYRACTAGGGVVWLRDAVKVLPGRRGIAERLRGAAFDITARKQAEGTGAQPTEPSPTQAELRRRPGST